MSKDTTIWMEDSSSSATIFYTMAQLDVDATGSKFTSSNANYWSNSKDLQVEIRPNGVLTGGVVTPGTAVDTVDVEAITCWLNGVPTTVGAAAAELLTRGVTLGFRINAVTISAAGAIVIIPGTEGGSFSQILGGVGGAPYIPIDSILVAMVYLTNISSAIVLATEIKQSRGRDMEQALYPPWEVIYKEGAIEFSSKLPEIHTGDVPKSIYASFGAVVVPDSFTLLLYTDSFKIPENTLTKTDTYFHDQRAIVDVTQALVGGTFDITAKQDAGIGSFIVAAKDDSRWLLVYPDKFRKPYILCPPAKVSLERDAITAAAGSVKATVTMMVDEAAIEKSL